MAVNSIVFGGVDSADYGIYISGEGVFDAPKRDVEMIEIPGRNGAFALDNGRFENIEVTYPAFNFEPNDYETFAQNLSDFRNALCSQKGYQRLTDSFHPDEYRMAVYKDGLDVKPVKYNTASEFNIVFDCKPQRWLTSGETAVSVESGDELTNPTLFESSPLLEVEGYGNIGIGGETITIQNEVVGHIDLAGIPKKTSQVSGGDTYIYTYTFDSSMFNAGDVISIARIDLWGDLVVSDTSTHLYDTAIASESGTDFSYFTYYGTPYVGTYSATVGYRFFDMTFAVGTAKTYTRTTTYNVDFSGSIPSEQTTISFSVVYDGADTITLSFAVPPAGTNCFLKYLYLNTSNNLRNDISGESTKSALGNPLYIDLDIGEAWNEDSGTPVSVNNAVTIPATLPTLASGANEITFDNTVTDLKVIPRWWKI